MKTVREFDARASRASTAEGKGPKPEGYLTLLAAGPEEWSYRLNFQGRVLQNRTLGNAYEVAKEVCRILKEEGGTVS